MDKRNDKLILGVLVLLLLIGGAVMFWRPWENRRTPRVDIAEEEISPRDETTPRAPVNFADGAPPRQPTKEPPADPPKGPEKEPPKPADPPAREPDENFTARAPQPPGQPFEGSQEVRFIVSGTVEDAGGVGLPGWNIQVDTWIWNPDPKNIATPRQVAGLGVELPLGKSGEGGRFRVDAYVNVPPGFKTLIWVRARKFGTNIRIPAVVVEPNGAPEVFGVRLVEMLPTTFSARLIDESGQPLKKVAVDCKLRPVRRDDWPDVARYNEAQMISAATDDDGMIVFKNVPPGDYDLFTAGPTPHYSEAPLRVPPGGHHTAPAHLGDVRVYGGVWLTWTNDLYFRMPPYRVTKISATSEETGATTMTTSIGVGEQPWAAFLRCVKGETYRVFFYFDYIEKPYEVAKFTCKNNRHNLGDLDFEVD